MAEQVPSYEDNAEEIPQSTYLIEFTDGKKKKITVPSSWKVTFGPVAVQKKMDVSKDYQNKMPLALRFYEQETKQRAIFTNVANFRDMSIKIVEERISTETKVGHMEIDGSKKAMNVQTSIKEWVNPDDEDKLNEPVQIVHDTDFEDIGKKGSEEKPVIRTLD